MALPTVRIHRSLLHAVGDDAGSALAVLHVAEAATPRAIESAAAAAGDEVVVLRRVDLRFAVDLDGGPAPLDALIEGVLTRAVRERITHARANEPHPVITADAAWFPDERTAGFRHHLRPHRVHVRIRPFPRNKSGTDEKQLARPAKRG